MPPKLAATPAVICSTRQASTRCTRRAPSPPSIPAPSPSVCAARSRPGHFRGVATIVTKLLLQARPNLACFGEKDFQQLHVIRRLVRDLDIPVRIEPVATVREPDGLALSSRNAYLSSAERTIAPRFYRTLAETAENVRTGAAPRAAEAHAAAALRARGFSRVDYVEICDAETLMPLQRLDRPARVLGAAWLGTTRLIDNLALLP